MLIEKNFEQQIYFLQHTHEKQASKAGWILLFFKLRESREKNSPNREKTLKVLSLMENIYTLHDVPIRSHRGVSTWFYSDRSENSHVQLPFDT